VELNAPPPPPPRLVILEKTDESPFVPCTPPLAAPAPPPPTVTVIGVPEATAKPVSVLYPPAPPPPKLPPPPPPATTKYSTVDVTGTKDIEPLVVQVYILYPPAVVIVGEPVVLVAAA
jgi:hypothetical protein